MKLIYCFLFTALHVVCFAQQQPQPNYDEQKVAPYSLPEVLKTTSNKAVKDKNTWENERRPEILKMFEDNVYGQMPRDYDSIQFEVVEQKDGAMMGKARMNQVDIKVYRAEQSVVIHLLLFVPTSVTGRVPLFLFINNRGRENTDASREVKSAFWPAELVIDSSFAIASFHVSDVAPDNKDSFMNGALRLYPEQINANNGMRAIGAWAWGAARVMDYLQTSNEIDAKRVVIVGHSRGGKAALWAAAQDQRFAICVSNCSGNSGAALSHRKFGETISMINTSFPHWFTPNYKKYNDNERALPIDQHMLISSIAPRPVYVTNASKDLWADPSGTFLSMKHAEKVYALYGLTSHLPEQPPAINTPVIEGPLAYHNREGIHDLTEYDWNQFVMYAAKYFRSR